MSTLEDMNASLIRLRKAAQGWAEAVSNDLDEKSNAITEAQRRVTQFKMFFGSVGDDGGEG